ncbi:MAG: Histidinol-phosphatase [Parcubacteria bacterium C7867-003]|nr:MAG: Histidinol-phosphatase [Parcubacteria bacterium C7867-003]
MKKAVFIDRDGILNQLDPTRPQGIPTDIDQFKATPGIRPLLQRLRNAGLPIIVTTHQPGLSDGSLSWNMLNRMHNVLTSLKLVDDILVCPHKAEEKCPCCPPAPGLFREAGNKYELTLNYCFAVSLRWQEIAAIKTVGGIPIQIQSPKNARRNPIKTVKDFEEAVDKIISMNKQNPQ